MIFRKKIILLSACILTSSFTFLYSQTSKIKELESQRLKLKNEIKEINSLLIDNTKKTKMAYGDLENISIKINRNQDLIKITNDQINMLVNEISENENKVSELNIIVEKAKDDYSKMVFNSYKSRLKESKLMFLLSSDNFLQALKRTQYMNQYSVNRRNYANKISSSIDEIKIINDTINKSISKKESLLIENRMEEKNLSKEKERQSGLIIGLKRKEKSYKNEIDKKQKLSNQLDKEIERLIKLAIKESNKDSDDVFKLTPEAVLTAKNFLLNKGNLPWPVERGVIIQRFGLQPHPVVRTTKIQSNGIVIATTKNAEVRSVFNGKVLSVLKFKSSNLTVLIQHGNYITAYKNLSRVNVEKGDNVNSLQVIGNAFNNDKESKTTLQFSIFENTKPLDPYLWIAK